MPKYGIYSPTLGKREDFPVILLDKAITPENSNVQIEDGEIKTAKMRENLFSGNGIGIPILKHFDDTADGGSGGFWFSIDKDFLPIFDGNKFYITFYYSYYDATTGLYTNFTETPRFYTGTGFGLIEYTDQAYTTAVPAGVKSASDSNRIFLSIAMAFNPLTHAVDATPLTLMYEATADTGKTSGQTASAPTDFDAANSPIILGNVHFNHSKLPDGNVPLKLVRFVLPDDSTEKLIAFTKLNIYYYYEDGTTQEWRNIKPLVDDTLTENESGYGGQITLTECTYWDVCLYGNYICVTNGEDKPMFWSGIANGDFNYFQVFDTRIDSAVNGQYITKAKFIASYCDYIMLGNVTLSSGTGSGSDSVYWSNIGDAVLEGGFIQGAAPEPGRSNDAGNMEITGDGEITGGMALYRGTLIVFKRYSIRKVWFTASTIPFSQDEQSPSVGCEAPGSVIHDKDGNLYFYGSDKLFREINYGSISNAIPVTSRFINDSLVGKIVSTYIKDYNEIWWAVPAGSIAGANIELADNNIVLCFSNGKWVVRDIQVVAFGYYVQQDNYDWDKIPYQSWDVWDWPDWDNSSEIKDVIDICSDADGYMYSSHTSYKDIGEDYTSFFTLTTDMANKQALAYQKRILQMYFYFDITESLNTIVNIYSKRDTELDWRTVGSIILSGTQKIVRKRLACDIRAGTFQFKVSATDPFRFIGVEFDYNYAGER